MPPGGSILLRVDMAVDSTAPLMQAAAIHRQAGVPVTWVSTRKGPKGTRAALIADNIHGVSFIDGWSAAAGSRDPESQHVVAGPAAMRNALRSSASARTVLLIDAADWLFDGCSSEEVKSTIAGWRATIACAAAWNVDAADAWPMHFGAEVTLRAVEERLALHQTMRVARSLWGAPTPAVLFTTDAGGISVHVPKLVVIGPASAGKTTFVQAAGTDALSVDRLGTTVAMDRATAHIQGAQVEIFGTPGQRRFDPLLPTLAGRAQAAILIVDATAPDSFARASSILRVVWRQGLTAVVALNKQDAPGALKPGAAVLDLPPGVPVLPCTATDPSSARGVVEHILHLLGVLG